MTSASTGVRAWASTSAGRPTSCASSPMNAPGPWVTIGSARAARVPPRYVNFAGQNHRHAVPRVANLCQGLASGIGAEFAEAAEPIDLRSIERRKHLVATGVRDRWGRWRQHGDPLTGGRKSLFLSGGKA